MKPIVKFCLPFFKLKKRKNLTQILIFQLSQKMNDPNIHASVMLHILYLAKMSVYIFIFYFFHIQIFFLVNFQYVANAFYLKIRESSYSALISRPNVVLESLKTRIGRSSPSAGRVYFNISREKPAHIHTYIYLHHLYLSSAFTV